MITDRDKNIIRHMEQYKFATLEQLEKIFFRQQKNSYNIARRRMQEIKRAGYVKVERDIQNNRLVYMLNDPKVKMPEQHRLIILDILAQLHVLGMDVHQFEVEKWWPQSKVKSDALAVFALDNGTVKNRYHYFIEAHPSHNPYNLEKYDRLYESGEVQEYLGRNVFPRVLLLADRNPKDIELRHAKVVTANLDAFAAVVLP